MSGGREQYRWHRYEFNRFATAYAKCHYRWAAWEKSQFGCGILQENGKWLRGRSNFAWLSIETKWSDENNGKSKIVTILSATTINFNPIIDNVVFWLCFRCLSLSLSFSRYRSAYSFMQNQTIMSITCAVFVHSPLVFHGIFSVTLIVACHSHSQLTFTNNITILVEICFQPSTIENLTVYIWQNLKRHLERPELLYEIELTDDQQKVVYNGNMVTQNKRNCAYLSSDTEWKLDIWNESEQSCHRWTDNHIAKCIKCYCIAL